MVKRSDAFPKNWMTAADLDGKPDPSTVPVNGQIKDCIRIRKPETVAKTKPKKGSDTPPAFNDEIPH
jgi:hypothetical protein